MNEPKIKFNNLKKEKFQLPAILSNNLNSLLSQAVLGRVATKCFMAKEFLDVNSRLSLIGHNVVQHWMFIVMLP